MPRRYFHFCYNPVVIEAIALNLILQSLADGRPRPYRVLTTPTGNITHWDLQRKVELLIADGMIKVNHDDVVITARGVLHLSAGGYTAEVRRHKRAGISFWLSIFAIIVSVVTFLLDLLNFFDS